MSGWFGQSWGAPVCYPETHVPTPDDAVCPYCEQPILPDDNGMVLRSTDTTAAYYHRLCFQISVIPCGMWDDEMAAHADKIDYQHAGSCQHQPRKDNP